MKTKKRIQIEYGSVKAALLHCHSLKLSTSQTARQLQCSRAFVRNWCKRYSINLRIGLASEERDYTVETRGIKYLRKNSYKRWLEKRGYSLSDPQTLYYADRMAGIR